MLLYKDQKHRDKFLVKMSCENESQDSYEIFKANYSWLRLLLDNSKLINRNRVK